jgi:hypothetical protein
LAIPNNLANGDELHDDLAADRPPKANGGKPDECSPDDPMNCWAGIVEERRLGTIVR